MKKKASRGTLEFIVCLSIALSVSCNNSPASTRVVRFPWTKSAGILYVRNWDSTDTREWRKLGNARGRVIVPAGKQLKLAIDYRKRRCFIDLTSLSRLGPGDLQVLDLSWTCVSEAELGHIEGLTLLRTLDLHETGVSDLGLAHLRNLSSLENLNLSATRISDNGLALLQHINSLQSLDLSFTPIGREGIQYLKHMHSLKFLNLHRTRVTAVELDELRNSLPNCDIPTNGEETDGAAAGGE